MDYPLPQLRIKFGDHGGTVGGKQKRRRLPLFPGKGRIGDGHTNAWLLQDKIEKNIPLWQVFSNCSDAYTLAFTCM